MLETHILVAEDDSTDAFFLERSFKRAGLPVVLHFVGDGQEAIDYLRGQTDFADAAPRPPQLVLLDLNLPRVNGFGVLSWIRKQARWRELPVIIFSSSDRPDDMERAQRLGANSYLVKPHSIADLTILVGSLKRRWQEAGHAN